MRKYVAAFYSNGKLVTGINHGEAFGKLTLLEQDSELDSGFFDPDSGRFFTEEYEFYLKQLYLVRHAEAADSFNAPITEVGTNQAHRTADYLGQIDLADFEALCSPYRRCLQTANIIANKTGLQFTVRTDLREKLISPEKLNSLALEFPQFKWPKESVWQFDAESVTEFMDRIDHVLLQMPVKCVLVTHCNVILNLAQEAIGGDVTESWNNCLPGASLTMIDSRKLICLGRECFATAN